MRLLKLTKHQGGNSFAIGTVQVHSFLVDFISGNDTAEAKIQGLQGQNDECEAFKHLVEHYEGVGIHAVDIWEADKVIEVSSMPERNLHIRGGRNSKSNSLEHLMVAISL